METSQGVVVGSRPEFLQAAPWKPVALGKKVKLSALWVFADSCLWPSPAAFRAVLVSWATF